MQYHQQIFLATTCVELQYPKSLWLSMRSASRFSLTLLRKRRGQDGNLLFLQLSDFILQLDNGLPNCPDLGRVTERAEGDMRVLQTALLLRSSRPLVIQAGTPTSYLLEELIVRAPQPCRARAQVSHQRDPLLVLIIRAVIPLPGPGSLASFPCCRSLPAGLTGFRVFPA